MPVDAVSISSGSSTAPIVCSWANRPDPATLAASQQVFFNDVPNSLIGSWWKPIPIAGVFAPLNGNFLLSVNTGSIPTDGTATEQVLQAAEIKSGMAQQNFRLEIDTIYAKDSGLVAGTYRVRIGTTGTVADTLVHSVAITSTTRTGRVRSSIMFASPTSVSVGATGNGATEQSLTVTPSAVAIPSILLNDLIVSVSFEPASAAVIALENCQIQFIAL